MCDGKIGGKGRHICAAPQGKFLAYFFHAGGDCRGPCNGESGPCQKFCGRRGLCCSKGNPDPEVGCDGTNGGEGDDFTCVEDPELSWELNQGYPCGDHCDGKMIQNYHGK